MLFSSCFHVDLKGLVEHNKPNFIPRTSGMINYVLLKFGNLSYSIEFWYGSIVLFNVLEHEVDGYLKIVEAHSSGLLPEGALIDAFNFFWMKKEVSNVNSHDIMLQYLNTDKILTTGSVLGQSIALGYYVGQIDGMVVEFTDINCRMEKTGTFEMERKKLLQPVGKANSNLGDVILKLGLFERSDIAWKNAKCAQIWEFLRDEFELTQRLASLDFKLKFLEEILQIRLP
ncbi:hypothetical protein SAY87_019341 [Trapa incisa]|uniref:DUF155 domain-containing protein n=1 Tax=Trapa incisa TaxID=236973 RepID=A0AAN7JZR3_9MYRT|nr:hypothetical protein SAY87_019341 [Trapa incisa]